jgi:hypothetical protein
MAQALNAALWGRMDGACRGWCTAVLTLRIPALPTRIILSPSRQSSLKVDVDDGKSNRLEVSKLITLSDWPSNT